MPVRTRIVGSPLLLCVLCGALAACGVSTSAGAGRASEPTLQVTLTKPPLYKRVSDGAAVQRLYTAAMALPLVPTWAVLNCPLSDGRVYHLSFSGGTFSEHQMTANASGCPLLLVGNATQPRWMDANFTALFTRTLGISSLDPYYRNG